MLGDPQAGHSLIDDLEGRLVFTADVQEAVQADPSPEPAVHAAAVNIARWIRDSPGRLSRWAWRIVDADDRSPADYERAQRAAASAFESNPARFARSLAKSWIRLHRPNKAIEVWREHVDARREEIPVNDPDLAKALIEYDRAEDAEPVLRDSLSILNKAIKLDNWWIAEARLMLGECLAKLARFVEAEALLIELADATLENLAASESRKAGGVQHIVDLYEAWDTAEPGQGYDAKAREWRARLPVAAVGSDK